MKLNSFVRIHAAALLVAASTIATLGVSQVRISQIYGGGGNTSAPFNQDFIELYNAGGSAVDISGWSVQYASATGTTVNTTFGKVSIPASTTIGAGKYYLIGTSTTGATGSALPTPDLTPGTNSPNLSGTAGKVILLNTDVGFADPTVTSGGTVVDYVGYGTTASHFETAFAPAPSNTTSIVRAGAGATDTNNNSADFAVQDPPIPRNSAFTSVADWMAY